MNSCVLFGHGGAGRRQYFTGKLVRLLIQAKVYTRRPDGGVAAQLLYKQNTRSCVRYLRSHTCVGYTTRVNSIFVFMRQNVLRMFPFFLFIKTIPPV